MFGSVTSCSPDGKFLVSLGSGGPGRVWDLTSSTAVASLPKENVRNFCNSHIEELSWINVLVEWQDPWLSKSVHNPGASMIHHKSSWLVDIDRFFVNIQCIIFSNLCSLNQKKGQSIYHHRDSAFLALWDLQIMILPSGCVYGRNENITLFWNSLACTAIQVAHTITCFWTNWIYSTHPGWGFCILQIFSN